MIVQEHIQTARDFLYQSDREFNAGEILQGSEKLWGAASHAVMSVAQQRGWSLGSHRDLKDAISRLSEEYNDPALRAEFAVAEKFHANFYHGFMEDYELEDRVIVQRLVTRLLSIGAPAG